MTDTRLVNISEFCKMICAHGHVDPTASSTCNFVTSDLLSSSKRVGKKCGARMGWSKSTVRAMCKQGRIPGAVLPGSEWLVNLAVATKSVIKRGKSGRPRGIKNE